MKYGKIINTDYTYNTSDDLSDVREIKGDLTIPCLTKASFHKLTSIGGYLYCRGADTKFRKDLKTEDKNNTAKKITVAKVIELTKGAYNNEKYEQFFKKGK